MPEPTIDPTVGTHAPNLLQQAEGVTKSFPGVMALSAMRLDLRRGEVFALVGENRAGKSTLMKLLTGINPMQDGQFWLEGQALSIENLRLTS